MRFCLKLREKEIKKWIGNTVLCDKNAKYWKGNEIIIFQFLSQKISKKKSIFQSLTIFVSILRYYAKSKYGHFYPKCNALPSVHPAAPNFSIKAAGFIRKKKKRCKRFFAVRRRNGSRTSTEQVKLQDLKRNICEKRFLYTTEQRLTLLSRFYRN